GEPRSPKADAIIVAPATYNTINKWAAGISDTYALGILAEAPGLGIPIVVLPFVNTALAGRTAFRRSVEDLRVEGIHILLAPANSSHTLRAQAEKWQAYFPGTLRSLKSIR
ncbi:flavoprotein, partial [Spirillospora sp. NPDC046719]